MARSKQPVYVYANEIKFRDREPADGQKIRIRLHGNKTYIPAVWQAAEQMARYLHCEGGSHRKYLMGWVPGSGE